MSDQGSQRPIGFIPSFFGEKSKALQQIVTCVFYQGFYGFSVLKIRVRSMGTKSHWVNPYRFFVYRIKGIGDIFVFLENVLVL